MIARKARGTALIAALVVAGAALLVLSACTTTKTMESTASIESGMRNSHPFKAYLQDDDITIGVKGEEVILEGTVPEESHKILAEKLAMDTPGVKKVDNKLNVEGGTTQKGSDAWLGSQIKAELMMHPDVDVAQTNVFVNKGEVTLRGQAENGAQKALIAEYVKNVKGVKNVINAMTVASVAGAAPQAAAPAQAVDDAAILAQAENALDSNASTSDLDLALESSGGVVTVIGTADNQAQKELVSRIIADIGGVTGVNNEIIVEEQPAVYFEQTDSTTAH
jgi:hyperosmotically inducible periplasmic protein